LGFVGFFIYGPQVLLVGTAPADLAKRGTAAAAAGFVNFMGYMGAFSGDLVTAALVERYDWQRGILFWAGCAFLAAIITGVLWNVTARSETHDDLPTGDATGSDDRDQDNKD
jgi:sugar phosphate permease